MGKKTWRIAAATGAALVLGAPLLTATPAHAVERDITLLSFSDYHGRITPDLTIPFAGQIEQLREEAGEESTLLLSGGDNIGATLFESAVDDDDPTIDILNALDVDASAVGNHEFDQGFDDLTTDVVEGEGPDDEGNPNGGRPAAEWDYLGANVYEAGSTDPALPAYGTYDVDGITVGVIGVVTQETPTLVLPAGVEDLEFGDPVDAVNRVAEELTDEDEDNGEADVLVAVYHEGFGVIGGGEAPDLDEAVDSSSVFDRIVNETDDRVSAIINGHSHQAYDYDGEVDGLDGTRPVIQAGEYASGIGQITITVEDEAEGGPEAVAATAEIVDPILVEDENGDESTEDELEALTEELAADYPRIAEIDQIIEDSLEFAEAEGSVVLAEAAGPITTAFGGGEYGEDGYTGGERDDRGSESALGNLVADALLTSLAPEDRGAAEIAVTNPGGLRSDFDAGEITVAEANNVLPFLNNLNTITLTGEQFVTLLEQQWQTDAEGNPTADDAFLALGLSANVSYTFDPDAAQGEHVTQVFIDGTPIDPAADYRIGTFSFLAQGGDNFRVFTEGTDLADSGLVDRDAWFAYLGSFGAPPEDEDEEATNTPIAADYSKRSAVFGDDTPVQATAGETLELTVSGLDQTSLGAPQVQSAAVGVLPEDGGDLADLLAAGDGEQPQVMLAREAPDAGIFLGDVEVVDGTAEVAVELPGDLSGTNQLFLATDTGSLVGITIEVEAAAVEPAPEPTPEPSEDPTSGPSQDPGADPTPAPIGDDTDDGNTGGPGDLADTGSNAELTALVALGAVLLLAGAATVLAARRRRS